MNALAFSPDGNTLWSGGDDRAIFALGPAAGGDTRPSAVTCRGRRVGVAVRLAGHGHRSRWSRRGVSVDRDRPLPDPRRRHRRARQAVCRRGWAVRLVLAGRQAVSDHRWDEDRVRVWDRETGARPRRQRSERVLGVPRREQQCSPRTGAMSWRSATTPSGAGQREPRRARRLDARAGRRRAGADRVRRPHGRRHARRPSSGRRRVEHRPRAAETRCSSWISRPGASCVRRRSSRAASPSPGLGTTRWHRMVEPSASAASLGDVVVVDAVTGEVSPLLHAHDDFVESVTFAPDYAQLRHDGAGRRREAVGCRDAAAPRLRPAVGAEPSRSGIVPRRRSGADRLRHRRDLRVGPAPDAWEAYACKVAGRNLTTAEWAELFPGQAYRVTCPDFPAGE